MTACPSCLSELVCKLPAYEDSRLGNEHADSERWGLPRCVSVGDDVPSLTVR